MTSGVGSLLMPRRAAVSETRNYVQRVLENAVVYDLLHPDQSRSRGDARLSWYLGRTSGT